MMSDVYLLFCTILLTTTLSTMAYSAQNRVDIGLFSQQDVNGWKQKEFSGQTDYSIITENQRPVLLADSVQSASAFYKKVKVNLEHTPILNWSWSKQLEISPGKEADKSGDDFVARIYVIKDGGFLFWNTLAINYVWSSEHNKGDVWDNPFAGKNAKMVSQQDAQSPAKIWFAEKRNVVQDFWTLHGKKISHIDGIAIMTDSDNSGLAAQAYYGDIYFTAE